LDVTNYFNKIFFNQTNKISDGLKFRGLLNKEDVNQYFSKYNEMKNFDQFIIKYMQESDVKNSAEYITALNEIISK
jgi:hypothetical protein